jgi:hypothetical protein
MWVALTSVAEALGTTPNDALVRLAGERLEDRERELALQRRAEERWQAFTNASSQGETKASSPGNANAKAKPLSERELVALSRAFREDD